MNSVAKLFGVLLISFGIGFSSSASAAGELGKIIARIQISPEGNIAVSVQSPGPSSVTAICHDSFGFMNIAHNAPARSVWLSVLLVAKVTQTPIDIGFDEFSPNCSIESVTMP